MTADSTPDAAVAATALTWQLYANLQCPVLAVRGGLSDLLSPQTLTQMRTVNPRTQAVEIPGVGHAPTFMDASQIEIAAEFLLAR